MQRYSSARERISKSYVTHVCTEYILYSQACSIAKFVEKVTDEVYIRCSSTLILSCGKPFNVPSLRDYYIFFYLLIDIRVFSS